MRMIMLQIAIPVVTLLTIGIGVGWYVHPGAGMAVAAGLMWLELNLMNKAKPK